MAATTLLIFSSYDRVSDDSRSLYVGRRAGGTGGGGGMFCGLFD